MNNIKIVKNCKCFLVSSPDAPGFKDFWNLLKFGLWEFDTFEVLNEFLDKRHSYIDIGAWVGPTVLFGCQISKHCYAIEPDLVAFKILQENIDLNSKLANNITLYKGCIGDQSGVVKLGTKTEFGDSMSSLLFNQGSKLAEVQSLTLEDFINVNKINDSNFIKMDIEGGEIKVLPTIKEYLQVEMPHLFLSLHPFWFENKEADIATVIDVLSVYPHIYCTDGKEITLEELRAGLSAYSKRYYSVLATAKWNLLARLGYRCRFKINRLFSRINYYLMHPFNMLRGVQNRLRRLLNK